LSTGCDTRRIKPYAEVNGLERGFEAAAKLAGIKGITFHNMRDRLCRSDDLAGHPTRAAL
jgi:hypothetical protein